MGPSKYTLYSPFLFWKMDIAYPHGNPLGEFIHHSQGMNTGKEHSKPEFKAKVSCLSPFSSIQQVQARCSHKDREPPAKPGETIMQSVSSQGARVASWWVGGVRDCDTGDPKAESFVSWLLDILSCTVLCKSSYPVLSVGREVGSRSTVQYVVLGGLGIRSPLGNRDQSTTRTGNELAMNWGNQGLGSPTAAC